MKLTLFTLPKPFAGVFEQIQNNALESWRHLRPPAQLLLFGDEPGTREAAARVGADHVPQLQRNRFGTPLVNDLFRQASRHSQSTYHGFVNSDIILDPALCACAESVFTWRPRALLVSRRWDLDVTSAIDFSAPDWFERLSARARSDGELYSHLGMDVFIFPRGLFDHMPPFSIGWPGAKYDNWLVYAARKNGLPVVDITDALTNVHQNHPPGGTADPARADEHWINLDHLGGFGCCYDILDATHTLGSDGAIRRRARFGPNTRRDMFRFAQRLRYRVRRHLLGFRYSPTAPDAEIPLQTAHR